MQQSLNIINDPIHMSLQLEQKLRKRKIKSNMVLVKLEKLLLMFLILTTLYGKSISTFYKVGDSAGWTNTGNSDYHGWTTSKTFAIGDTLLFQYDKQFHNVLRVDLQHYHSCNASSPIAQYTSGNDSFTIGGHGHFFFICGIPGHCLGGQKLDIRVPKELPQTISGSTGMAPPNQERQEGTAPPGLSVLPPDVVSGAGVFTFSRFQIVMLLLFGFCFCCYAS